MIYLFEDDILEQSGYHASVVDARWLHKDCIEDVVKDRTGDERYCSFCIDNTLCRLCM